MLKTVFDYLGYIIIHKYYVYKEGRHLGLGCIHLLMHDLSKFRLSEFIEYARWKAAESKDGGGSIKNGRGFGWAWFYHAQKYNDHHWEWWVYVDPNTGKIEPIEMSDRARKEMLADWRATQKIRFGNRDVFSYYMANKDNILLHPNTRAWLEERLCSAKLIEHFCSERRIIRG